MMNMDTRASYKDSLTKQVSRWKYGNSEPGTPPFPLASMLPYSQQSMYLTMAEVIQGTLEVVASRYLGNACDIYNVHVDMFNQAYIDLVQEFIEWVREELNVSIEEFDKNIDKIL